MSESESRAAEAMGTAEVGRLHPFEPPFGQVEQGLDELRAAGEVGWSVKQVMYLALLQLMAKLKGRRESMGLSLDDVSERSGMTTQEISELEIGQDINPRLESVWRHARTLDAQVILGIGGMGTWEELGG